VPSASRIGVWPWKAGHIEGIYLVVARQGAGQWAAVVFGGIELTLQMPPAGTKPHLWRATTSGRPPLTARVGR
jgi:hypothetical protein